MDKDLLERLSQITPEEREALKGKDRVDRALYADAACPHFVVDRKKLLDSGKLIHIRPHTRFVHFPPHTHNYVEMIYMCSGSTTHLVNGSEVLLREGELLFLSQTARQEILPAGERDIAVNFIILPEFFDQALSMLGTEADDRDACSLREFIVGCLTSSSAALPFLHFRVAGALPVQNLVENLIWTLVYGAQNKRRMNQITMGLLFLHLMRYTDRIRAGTGGADQELLLAVLQYVEEHYRAGTLGGLAEQLDCELTWLSKRIKKLAGRTFTELIQSKRLNQAKYLLATTRLSVLDVSLAVGYDNFSYFHRLFSGRFGISPGKYRKEGKEKPEKALPEYE